jgi:hypothetical protein
MRGVVINPMKFGEQKSLEEGKGKGVAWPDRPSVVAFVTPNPYHH